MLQRIFLNLKLWWINLWTWGNALKSAQDKARYLKFGKEDPEK